MCVWQKGILTRSFHQQVSCSQETLEVSDFTQELESLKLFLAYRHRKLLTLSKVERLFMVSMARTLAVGGHTGIISYFIRPAAARSLCHAPSVNWLGRRGLGAAELIEPPQSCHLPLEQLLNITHDSEGIYKGDGGAVVVVQSSGINNNRQAILFQTRKLWVEG